MKARNYPGLFRGGIMKNTDEYVILSELCKRNGRFLSLMNDGTIVTQDKYDGCDAQFFETYEDAIEWEKGYISPEESEIIQEL